MTTNPYWKEVNTRPWEDKKYIEGELIVPDPDKILSVIATATLAGIPLTKWHEIYEDTDTTDCYYESDPIKKVWRFPISVFDK